MAKLTVAESLALIHKEIDALQKKEKALLSQNKGAALAQIVQIAKENALTVADITGALRGEKVLKTRVSAKRSVKKVAKPRGKVPAKYRNPADHNQTWTGRGKMPAWVKELKDHKSLDKALIS